MTSFIKLETAKGLTEVEVSNSESHSPGLYNRSLIERAPPQLYCSALVSAPEKSMSKKVIE
jgi:hypothetical protein